ncbi:hypothetical protein GCM10027422_21770 [Hymenobacter arcticus]
MPTRLLAEYGLPLLPLTSFNGTLADSTRTNPTLFRALYASAYTACIWGANPLASLPAYNAQVEAVEASSPTLIPIMVQRIDYATLRPEARSQNLLSVQDNQLYDVAGRSQSPYQSRTLFAAAPSREYASSSTVTLILPRSLYIEYLAANPNVSLRSLELDLADGNGYQPVSWDQRLTTSYTSAGAKRIKIRFTYQQTVRRGNIGFFLPVTYESQFDLIVPPPAASQASSNATARTNNLASLADDSVLFAAAPGRAAGKAYIYYSASRKGSKKLVKPLIVLEGFDKHHIAPHISPVNYSLDQFLREIETTNGFNFRNALENTGDYDIVFVDYANGTDDILLNAGLFEQVLSYVNTNKDPASTEQNVVMGMSMGGVIGRYKLAQLEKANPGSTHVRLLILQDSPQRGANLPLGYAAAVRQANNCFLRNISLKDVNAYIKESVALLDQAGTRQLLKYQALGPNDSDFFANTFLDGPYRQMITYAAPYRIVAVSQGSQCGVGLFPPYTELLRGSASSFNGILGYIIQSYLPSVPGFGGEVVLNALPGGSQSARVSGLYLYTQIRILRFIPIRITLTRQNFSCPGGLLPLDGAAGSTEPFVGGPNVIAKDSPGWLGPLFSYQYALRSRFSFISPASALDIADFTLPALSAKYINSSTSISTTSTNDFVAQEQTNLFGSTDFNVPHLTFTARNGEWIFNQMQNDLSNAATVACSTECSAVLAIAGPTQVCTSPTSVFSVNTSQVTWSAEPSSYFTTITGSGSQFVTSAAPGAYGSATITATFPCGPPVTKTVSVGATSPTGRYRYNGANYTLSSTNFVMGYNSPITITLDQPYSFTFSSNTPAVVLYNTSTNSTTFSIPSSVTSTVKIAAVAAGTSSDCGLVGDFIFVPTGPRFAAAPNPATSELTVSDGADEPTSSAAKTDAGTTKSFQADLYDTYGKKVKTKQSEGGKAVFDVRDVPDGLYNLRVGQGKDAYSEHIQITH